MGTLAPDAGVIGLLRRLHQLLHMIETGSLITASLGVLAMMFVTAVDVIMRYAFSSPFTWWYDFLMNYVLIATFYLVFSYTLAHHGHLSVDFFANKLPRKTAFLMLAVGFLATGILMFLISKSSISESIVSYRNNEVLAGVILWPMWISKAIVGLGMSLLALRSLHFAASYLAAYFDDSALRRIGVVPQSADLEEVAQ